MRLVRPAAHGEAETISQRVPAPGGRRAQGGRHRGRRRSQGVRLGGVFESVREGEVLLRRLQAVRVPRSKKTEIAMHPPFEEEIVYLMTGSYLPWLPEGWPFMLLAALCFWGFLSADRGVRRIRREIADDAMREQERARRRQ